MRHRFAEIVFTPSVKAAQRRYNGSELQRAAAADPRLELGVREREFIAARDSFYLATVSETGWPHVQHRGGPVGFLQVLAPTTIGFADFGGNRQYVSVGNLGHDGRLALILMDYPNRRRLKILGRARVIDATQADPELLARLAPARGEGTVERLVLIQVEAFDWNCSQHITPRYTEAEWRSRLSEPEHPHQQRSAQ
ncbi:pyridoxamine 5'-phosphate oxidase family protein [Azoarcus sp. KH32C]|uniref:pyridoxamine 5'-phosphate oxidase family protein n=1 Tax=Azoarcus sp. KH32C TaxID=748247 RepID=UPI0002385D19|nr:pyridoxamine 5'-phosphate oxidase family protein [Azoarcus sp. KH32C]BAL26973.1 pyridoxamine 5'-phosphate oxidase-related FMN-binding protein [Azoarcus sp. KH32C]